MIPADLVDKLVALVSGLTNLAVHARRLLRTAAKLRSGQTPPTSYENVSLDIVLDIRDPKGQRAVLERRQRVRFLTSDSGAVRDLVWGEGNTLVHYTAVGARRLGVRPEGSKRAVLLALGRRPQRGEQASVRSRRVIAGGLTQPAEYWEAMVERPTQRLSLQVLFPPERPPREAHLVASAGQPTHRIRVRYRSDGRPCLSWRLRQPVPDCTYSLCWTW
jgi:hypothetical protein